jgi:hypothetical protein
LPRQPRCAFPPLPYQALASSVKSAKSVVQFFLVAAGRGVAFPPQKQASHEPPKKGVDKN